MHVAPAAKVLELLPIAAAAAANDRRQDLDARALSERLQLLGLAACAPAGAAWRAEWTWKGGDTVDVRITASSASGTQACAAEALSAVRSDLKGTCSAVILGGSVETARTAADRLSDNPNDASTESLPR